MKLRNLIFLIYLFSTALFSCSRIPKVETSTISFKIDSLLQNVPDFSGVILVAEKEKILYHKAFGFRNIERKTPLDTADIFELASLSKQFTAMIVMMLQEQGKLNYEDAISKYIPDLPYRNITIRHLLTHTSGLPNYQSVMDEHWDKTKIASNKDNIEYLIRYHPAKVFEPGVQFEYSNTGYMLLATIAEKASGEDFITLCRNRIFIPLNMTSTDIRTQVEKKQIENFAMGYIYVSEKERYVNADSFPEFNYTIWLGNRMGPGRVSSTSGDLLKWDRALYSEKLVRQTTLIEAFSPMKLISDSLSRYGFGWRIGENAILGKFVFHTGNNPGYKTEIVRYIDAGKTIILLNNNAHERKEEIISFIKDLLKQ